MKSSAKKIELKSVDDLFTTEESRQEADLEKVQMIALSELYPFPDHPFSVRDDDSMKEMIESVREYGVLAPVVARPREGGGYELVAGHRRKYACELAGLDTIPVIVRDLDRDTATIFMVDSNLQRENILPIEKAKAYKMKLEAMDAPSTNVVIGTNGDTQTVVVTNTPKGGLLIRKIDSVTGQTLPGVKFKITAANGELVPDNEGLTSSNGLYTTDENGQIYLQKLNPNTYVVTEVETIDGYLLDAMPQTVVVSEADTQVLTFTNMPLGGLLVKKMDSATKEPLADVIFKITRTDGTVVGNSNGEYRTDERG